MKKIKRIQVVNLVLIVISILVLPWITNLHGFTGLCRWNPFYKNIVSYLWAFNILILVIFIISVLHLKSKKILNVFKWISISLSSLFCLVLVGLFFYLTIPTFSKPDEIYSITEVSKNNKLNEKEPLLSLAVSSDPHWGSERSNKDARDEILKNIGESDYDAFLCLGDIAELGSTESFYKEAANDFNKYLNETPIHVVLGNHDALINGTGVFKKYFQKNHDYFYSRIDYDNLHIITLDILWDAKEFDKNQKQWLIEQLEEIPEEDMTIVLSHCFGYSSGYLDSQTGMQWYDNKDVIEKVASVIEEYNVELMISGHNHLMELLKHGNTYYGIIGTMGGHLDSQNDYTSPQSIWLNNNTFGWLDIQVYENFLELTYKDQTGKNLYKVTVENNL